MKAYLFKFKGSTVLTDCGAGFVVIAGNFLERPVSFLNQVLIWYDSCRQKQTSAHPDAMLVYDNVETAIAEKLARRQQTYFYQKGNDTGLSGTAS